MSFQCPFQIGQVVTHDALTQAFKCGNMGGMRRSKATNSLVIISDHTKGLYEDKWYRDVLHYTGMGKSGDQSLSFMQNKTLAECNYNSVDVHLFEVLAASQYIYRGKVTLASSPYQEVQSGEDGLPRKVWMFPLQPMQGVQAIDEITFEDYIAEKKMAAKKLSLHDLCKRANSATSTKASSRYVNRMEYVRDPYIAEYTKRRANGICQLCGKPAPFTDKDGEPYLQSHHIEWLSKGGSDTPDNTAALCPNCHCRMHTLDLLTDVQKLKTLAKGR